MALRGIQEYIARDANNIARVEKEPSNIVIIHTGLCVSYYYLTILSDCQLPFCLFTNRPKKSACGVRACVQRNSSCEATPFAS